MYKTEAQIVSYAILYLNPSSYQFQPSYKKYIAVQTPPNTQTNRPSIYQLTLIKTGVLSKLDISDSF